MAGQRCKKTVAKYEIVPYNENANDCKTLSTHLTTHTVGLKTDGTVVATKYIGNPMLDFGQCDVSDWKDIVAVAAGDMNTVGLKEDGTVVAVGYNGFGQCDVDHWKDIRVPGK